MSGGLAFVLDLDRDLVNGELVDVEDVTGELADVLREIMYAHATLHRVTRRGNVAQWLAGRAVSVLSDCAAGLPAGPGRHPAGSSRGRGCGRRRDGRRAWLTGW